MANPTFSKHILTELSVGQKFSFYPTPHANHYLIADTDEKYMDTVYTCINTMYGTTITLPKASCIEVFVAPKES